jgi:hypothetical protein
MARWFRHPAEVESVASLRAAASQEDSLVASYFLLLTKVFPQATFSSEAHRTRAVAALGVATGDLQRGRARLRRAHFKWKMSTLSEARWRIALFTYQEQCRACIIYVQNAWRGAVVRHGAVVEHLRYGKRLSEEKRAGLCMLAWELERVWWPWAAPWGNSASN